MDSLLMSPGKPVARVSKKYTVVLDLDDVLLNYPKQCATCVHTFFEKYTVILEDQYDFHYICPAYIIEFMKYLVANFNISFFSTGNNLRNEFIVEKLWQRVFDCPKPDHVVVLSRDSTTCAQNREYHDCSKGDNEALNPPNMRIHGGLRNEYWNWRGNNKKDITKINPFMSPEERRIFLKNTVLIDDDPTYVMCDQIKNYLDVPGASFLMHDIYTFCGGVPDKSKYLLSEFKHKPRDYIGFHQLLYVVGILEAAATYKDGIAEGIADIFFPNGESMHRDVRLDTKYYKKGFEILSRYATDNSYPILECLENLILETTAEVR